MTKKNDSKLNINTLSQGGVTDGFGISTDLASKVIKRFEMFREEYEREAVTRLAKSKNFYDTKGKVDKKSCSEYVDERHESAEGLRELKEEFGTCFSFLDVIDAFVKSALFTSLDWELKTPNDFFVLGYIVGGSRAKESVKGELTEGLQQLIQEFERHTGEKAPKAVVTEISDLISRTT